MRDQVTESKTLLAVILSRELALAADRSLWAGDRGKCSAIIDQIYDLFDNPEHELDLTPWSRIAIAETAAWIGNVGRCAELLDTVRG